MLVFFHSIIFIINKLQKIFFPSKDLLFAVHEESEVYRSKDKQTFIFDPPVYMQRYGAAYELFLKDREIKKVLDCGCAEMGLFYFLRQMYSLEEVIELDVDATLLNECSHKVEPMCSDYRDRRTTSFTVHLLAGSISDPSPRFIGTDAVVAIEIIEHLYPDTLDALPYNIFNYIKPKLAIFTTPNADFNVLFLNFKGLRHYDHKFEWTCEQFESWGKNIAVRFPNYSVTFQGIGKGPDGTENLGCCSQMALFTKKSITEHNLKSDTPEESFGVCTYFSYSAEFVRSMKYPYKLKGNSKGSSEIIEEGNFRLIKTIEFPVTVDNRTPEQIILDEFISKINLSSNYGGLYYNKDEDVCEIPLINLFLDQRYSCSFDEAIKMLQGARYTIEERLLFNELTTCVIAEAKNLYCSPSVTPSVSDEEIENHSFDKPFIENDEYDWGNKEFIVENSADEWH